MAHPASSIDWIIKQSHRYPLLTPTEEIVLARHVQNWLALADVEQPTTRQKAIIAKGRRARERFFLSNIRLVVNVAGRYHKYAGTMSLEDLVQEGLLGLDSGIAKFDPSLGYKFSTYSYWWIRQGITRSINRYSRIIHLPTSANDAIRKAMDFMHEQVRKTGKLPPMQQVCEICNVSEPYLIKYLHFANGVMSLDQRMNNSEDNNCFLDVVADPRSVEAPADDLQPFTDALYEALDELSPAHQHVIEQRYLNGSKQPTPYRVLGEELQISRQATQQLHNRAMKCLRLKLGGLQGQECIQALQSAA